MVNCDAHDGGMAAMAWNELAPVVSYANRYIGQAGQSFGPRIIKDHQFIWVISGKGKAVIRSRVYEAGRGDLFYYGPDAVHTFTADRHDPFVLYGVHFSWRGELPRRSGMTEIRIAAVRPDRDEDDAGHDGLLIRTERAEDALLLGDKQSLRPERIEPRLAKIVELYHDGGEYVPQLLRALFLELIVTVKREMSSSLYPSAGSAPVRLVAGKLRAMAEARYDRGWLAEWTAYNPDHMSRLFRRETGLTPYHYFMREKLELTKRLLLHTDEPLASVAERTGAASIHSFTRWFKEQTGIPPGKYRQQSRQI